MTYPSAMPSQRGFFQIVMWLVDFLTVFTASALAAILSQWLRPSAAVWVESNHYLLPSLVGAMLAPNVLMWAGAYPDWRSFLTQSHLRPIVVGIVVLVSILTTAALVTKTTGYYSRTWMGLWFALSILALLLSRFLLKQILRRLHRGGFDVQSIVLIGGNPLARRVANHLDLYPEAGFKPIGFFAFESIEKQEDFLPCLGDRDSIAGILERRVSEIDQVWIILPLASAALISDLMKRLRYTTVDIRFVPDLFGYQLLKYSSENVLGLPVLNLSSSPLSGANRYFKDVLDRTLAFMSLIVLSPLLISIALVVRMTSPGPIVFRQVRHGWDGQPFTVYKFRSMYMHGSVGSGLVQARRNDPRVTPVGRFLRKTNLDELPQLFNVMRGDMSLVGPRPHPVELSNQFRDQVDRYMWRHRVKPGITGWAQVNGFRGETDTLDKMQKRLDYDLYYIEHWSVWFDIKIIATTLLKGFSDSNAY